MSDIMVLCHRGFLLINHERNSLQDNDRKVILINIGKVIWILQVVLTKNHVTLTLGYKLISWLKTPMRV